MFKKLLFLFLIFTGLSFPMSAQQKIYITLDVSPSMYRKKYDLANYGAQMVTILNQDKEVVLIINSEIIPLSGNFQVIQKKATDFGGYRRSEIWDIDQLNEQIKSRDKNQDVFIIGDGIWHSPSSRGDVYNAFKKHYNSGSIKVTYLEVLDQPTHKNAHFGKYLRDEKIGKIYTVTSTEEIIDAINEIIEELTGISPIPLESMEYQRGATTLSFDAALALKGIKIVYQDKSTIEDLPEITSITANGKTISLNNIGNPSNSAFETKSGGLMSSRIYESNTAIRLGDKVTITFNQEINPERLKIYPSTTVEVGIFNVAIGSGQVTTIDANTIGVCQDNEEAAITFEFSQQGQSLDNEVLKKAEVTILSDGERYPARNENGKFTATIPLTGKTTNYQIESEIEGYFKEISGLKKIEKTRNCAPPSGGVKKMGKIDFGSISLSKLLREGRITGVIVDENSGETLSPDNFDIKLGNNYPTLFKKVEIEFKADDSFDIIIEPRGAWCDCFMPNELTIDFKAAPKKGYLIDGKQYQSMDYDLILHVVKEDSWLSRCKWLLIGMLASLLLAWLLILISRKDRFGRGTRIVFRFPSMTSRNSLNPQYERTDFRLRKKGLVAWFNRWFNPFVSEKNTLTFSNLSMSMQFIAAKSIRHVWFPRVSYDEKTMDSINYDPDRMDKFIKMDESSELKIEYNRGIMGKSTNFLEYNYPKNSWNDIAAFRFVLGVLIAILFLFFTISTILIIRSLF